MILKLISTTLGIIRAFKRHRAGDRLIGTLTAPLPVNPKAEGSGMKAVMMITILIGVVISSLTVPHLLNAESIYNYTDENGEIFITDNIEKLPESYKRIEKRKTPIIVSHNRIFAPVTITYRGNSKTFYLQVDTGCSGITISTALANKLGINQEEGKPAMSIVADGSQVPTHVVTVDNVKVGPKIKWDAEIAIMPRKDNDEFGLLGMSFLKEFPHTIHTKSE